jgi:acetyl esterase/lipase
MTTETISHQPIHPEVRPFLDPEYVAFHDSYFQYIVPDDRKSWNGSARTKSSLLPAMEGTPVEVGCTEDIELGKFGVRVFWPSTLDNAQRDNFPVLIWFHGGGWAVGDVSMSNDMCALVCNRAQCVVVTVGYRLAPEHPFPAAFEDAVEALQWIHSPEGSHRLHIDPAQIAVGGTSAGGQLTASLVMKAATLEPLIPIKFQLLVLPVIDSTASVDGIWARNKNAPWLTPARMLWYRSMYMPNEEDWSRWEASPNKALPALLAQTPKTWIAISEQDLLAPEAESYATQLQDAWVMAGQSNACVNLRMYEGSTHSLLAMSGMLSECSHEGETY